MRIILVCALLACSGCAGMSTVGDDLCRPWGPLWKYEPGAWENNWGDADRRTETAINGTNYLRLTWFCIGGEYVTATWSKPIRSQSICWGRPESITKSTGICY